MTLFARHHAHALADDTFRFRITFDSADEQKRCGKAVQPLVGKEDALLKALRAGEQRYVECKTELQAIQKLRRADTDLPARCAKMGEKLKEVVQVLSVLDDVSRQELDSMAHLHGSSVQEMSGHLEKLLSCLDAGSEELFSKRQKTAGRKRGVGKGGVQRVPLEEFAKELRNFLLKEGVPFTFEAATRDDRQPVDHVPVSAAARLLYRAARVLDRRVELSDIEAVIMAVNKKPEFREELLGDAMVDALTR
ncbi:hypothetical protein [Bradyrhizobium liaoningense]|uniref:hypothetical protein n=1 Tax=Bradyrhizobium liaoningense TaxID=43992 RepID=UPI001BA8DB68|nr:hypothetical protein [Bradyrhizobium liaoningense]MBR0940243.1 hypothetical protein [Bradyrhizobium liaoningense]